MGWIALGWRSQEPGGHPGGATQQAVTRGYALHGGRERCLVG